MVADMPQVEMFDELDENGMPVEQEIQDDTVPEMVVAPPMDAPPPQAREQSPQVVNMPATEIRAKAPKSEYTRPAPVDMPKGHIATYGLDPRVLQYLQRQSSLEGNIAKEVNRENWRTNRQQLFGDMLGGIASGASQIGTTFGKAPSVEGLQQQLAGQKATAEQYRRNAIKNLDEERSGLRKIDQRILDYLQPKQKEGRTVADKWLPALSKDNKPVWRNPRTNEEIPREGKTPPQKTGGRFLPTTGPDGKRAYIWAEPGEGLIPGPPEREKMVRLERFDPISGQTIVEYVPEKNASGQAKPPPESAQVKVKEVKVAAENTDRFLDEMRQIYADHGKNLANPFTIEHAEAQKRFQSLRLDYAKEREKLANPGVQVTLPEVDLINKWGMPFDLKDLARLENPQVLRLIDQLKQDVKHKANTQFETFGYQAPYVIGSKIKTPAAGQKPQEKPKELPKGAPQQQYKPIPKTADGKIDAKALVVGEVYKMPNGSAVRWDGNKFMPLGGK